MKRSVLYHVLFWAGIYLLWILIFRSYSYSITKTITIEFCYLIFITIDFYAINNFIVPAFLFKKKYSLFVAGIFLIIAFSAWLRALVALQMNMHFFHANPLINFNTLYFNSIINISLWVLLITIGKMLIDRIQTQQQLEYLEKEKIKAELDYLKAQINPHALFNSLNTIYGYIDKNNQIARSVLLQFSELLRYQLYDCGADKTSLPDEINYIKNYVAFQRLRKDDALIVDLKIGSIELGLTIAPLLLIVLIENAFKFVSSYCEKENKIVIELFTKEQILHASFINTKETQASETNAQSNGIGIINLKRRLALLYPHKHEFTIKNNEELYETNLTIDLS